MTDLTITVDNSTLEKAMMRASDEGTSVNAILKEYLESYAGSNRSRREAWRRIREIANTSGMSSGGGGLPRREELYDRRVLRDDGDK